MNISSKKQQGFGLIEVVIGIAIMGLVLVSAVLALTAYIRVGLGNTTRIQGVYLADGGLEVARGLRDANWDSFAALATNTPFHLSFNGSVWTATTTATSTLSGFTRVMTLHHVYRHSTTHDILPSTSTSPKYIDADTRLVVVVTSWTSSTPAAGTTTESVTLSTYLTNFIQ